METAKPVAFITGATSGIGNAFAWKFASLGFDLVITGRRQNEIADTAREISAGFQCNVETFIGDLSDGSFRHRLADRIRNSNRMEVLVNNAGFGDNYEFHESSIDRVLSMIYTHDVAAVELIHAALPRMIGRHRGTIINVSSLAAFLPGLSQTLYLATKSFIHNFSRSLSLEIARFGITVQSLCPGFTRSDFNREKTREQVDRNFSRIHCMEPEEVVRHSMRDLEKRRMLCIPGFTNKLFYLISRILPMGVFRILSRMRAEKEIPRPELKSLSVPSLINPIFPPLLPLSPYR
jgi:short-subunit dehydrogenase